jgi:flagellar motor switch protein FliG
MPDASSANSQKVAILLATLEKSLAVNLLKKLDTEDVKAILDSSSAIGPLKAVDVDPVVDEFAREFSGALGISADPEQLTALLESAFSAEQIASILGRPMEKPKQDVWARFTTDIESTLVPYMLDQHEQVTTFILSKLSSGLAAKCMSLLPAGMRKRTAERLVRINEVDIATIRILEEVLMEDIFAKGAQKKESLGVGVLAGVVNNMDRSDSVEVMAGLEETNPEEVKLLRRLIFMFEDVALLDFKQRTKLIDKVPVELIISALYGMNEEFRSNILSVLSGRSRRMVESELQGDIAQPKKDSASARRKIADIAINMSKSGDLELPSPDNRPVADEASIAAVAA